MRKMASPGRPNRKAEILAATERILWKRGIGAVTTRAIAKEVPCSEGAIYVHFTDRLDLVLAVLHASLPEMLISLHGLEQQVGVATAQQNLEEATHGLVRFHERVAPMLCSMLAEPELLERFQRSLQEEGKGPDRGIRTLGKYIKKEQTLGRISMEVDAMASARVLMASSFFHVFTNRLMGMAARLDVKALVRAAIRSTP